MSTKDKQYSDRDFEQIRKQKIIKARGMQIVSDFPFYARIPQNLIRNPTMTIQARITFGICHTFCREKILNEGSNTFASLETIGKMLGRHSTNVSRYLRELHNSGWITVLRRGLNKTNIIILHEKQQRR